MNYHYYGIFVLFIVSIFSVSVCSAEDYWYYPSPHCWDMMDEDSCLDYHLSGNNHCVWCITTNSCMEYNPCTLSLLGKNDSSAIFPEQLSCLQMITKTSSESADLECKSVLYWTGRVFTVLWSVILIGFIFCVCVGVVIWARDKYRKEYGSHYTPL